MTTEESEVDLTIEELEADLAHFYRKYGSKLSEETLLPELVSTLKSLLTVCELNLDDMEDGTRFVIKQAEAVLAKAEGRAT